METGVEIDINAIVDSLSDGLYVCDLDRRITYWSKSAERITGWTARDVTGLQCFDNILCHIDKDGHQLCGQEYCPLHRSMITGTGSDGSLLVFAQSKGGERIPMLVSVAPLRNAAGDVIGGVETFQDASAMVHDLERAKTIQQLALHQDLPEDPRIKLQDGDRLLLFSDGAVEISNAAGQMLGLDGLIKMLKRQGYPVADLQMQALEEDLLKYSNGIRLADDLTLIEIRIHEQGGGRGGA